MKHSAITRLLILLMLFAIGKAYAWSIPNGAGYPESYLISGIIDTFVVCSLSLFGRSNLVRDIQKINLLSVVAHLYGFIIYMMYFPPYSYDIILTILACLGALESLSLTAFAVSAQSIGGTN